MRGQSLVVCLALAVAVVLADATPPTTTSTSPHFVMSFSGGGVRAAAGAAMAAEVFKSETAVWGAVDVLAGLSGGCWGVALVCGHNADAMGEIQQYAEKHAKSGGWGQMPRMSLRTGFAAHGRAMLESFLGIFVPRIKTVIGFNPALRKGYENWILDTDEHIFLGQPPRDQSWTAFASQCKKALGVEPQCLVGTLDHVHSSSAYMSPLDDKLEVWFTPTTVQTRHKKTKHNTAAPIPTELFSVEGGRNHELRVSDVAALSSSAFAAIVGSLHVSMNGVARSMYDAGLLCDVSLSPNWHSKSVVFLFDFFGTGLEARFGLDVMLRTCLRYWKSQQGIVVKRSGPTLEMELPSLTRSSSGASLLSSQAGPSHRAPHGTSTRRTVDTRITPLQVEGWDNTVLYHVPMQGFDPSTGIIDRLLSCEFQLVDRAKPKSLSPERLTVMNGWREFVKAFVLPLAKRHSTP